MKLCGAPAGRDHFGACPLENHHPGPHLQWAAVTYDSGRAVSLYLYDDDGAAQLAVSGLLPHLTIEDVHVVATWQLELQQRASDKGRNVRASDLTAGAGGGEDSPATEPPTERSKRDH